ncbi:MAG: acyltransferase [Clostridiales bacterium]|nr:acyltransferase [Clostridiales bacterium]
MKGKDMEKRREIDFANVVLCLIVIFAHIISRAVSSLDHTSVQFAVVFIPSRLCTFAVPGFIFLSAMKYFMKYSDKPLDYGSFLKSRIKYVVLPYVLWNVIYYLALIPLGFFVFYPAELIKYIFVGNMISHFYFVVAIVQFYLLMPFWLWLVNKVSGKILIPVSLVIMILFGQYLGAGFRYNDRIFLKYIFYWICGCYAGKYSDRFWSFIKKYSKVIAAVFLLAAGTDGILTWINASGMKFIPQLENIHIFYCSVAILFLFSIAMWKSTKIVDNPIFGIINRQSYYIYLSHCLTLYYSDWFVDRFLPMGNGGILIFRLLVCYICTIGLWGAWDCIKRSKMNKSGC